MSFMKCFEGPKKETTEELRARWDREAEENSKAEAMGKVPTHVIEIDGKLVEAYYSKNGHFIRPTTGEILGERWKGPSVVAILGMTEDQRQKKADALRLFDKMMASERVASIEVPIAMARPAPGLQTYLRYMEKGPMMHIWYYDLFLDHEKQCELTSAENDRMVAAIKSRTIKPKLDPKQIEELL